MFFCITFVKYDEVANGFLSYLSKTNIGGDGADD